MLTTLARLGIPTTLAVILFGAGVFVAPVAHGETVVDRPVSDSEASLESDDGALIDLMAKMKRSRGVIAEFVEEKHLALLSAPLKSSGRLYYAPPDALLRMTQKPSRTRLLIAGREVRYRDDTGADRFDLSANSVARQFIENFLVLFTGDLPALRERYDIEFHADADRWKLELTPRRAPFDRMIEQVVLEGQGAALSLIRMTETDGDATETRITKMQADTQVRADELTRLFSE